MFKSYRADRWTDKSIAITTPHFVPLVNNYVNPNFYFFVQTYLSHFGYLHDLETDSTVHLNEARQAVKEFQDFANLPTNGKLNSVTLREMNKPRCGNRDARVAEGDEYLGRNSDDFSKRRRRKRDDSSPGVRWNKRVLTYRVAKFSSSLNLKPKTLQKEIDIAFRYWEREANLTFKKIWEGKVSI